MIPNSRLQGAIATLWPTATHEADDALLQRYVKTDDAAAFAALVRRYSSMVLAVCQRQLRQSADVEDAFQVVFMVLARDAKRIRNAEALPGWLHRVACRATRKLAMRNRSNAALENEPSGRESTPLANVQQRELAEAIDGELDRLPSNYRDVLLLCGMQGLTNVQAADRLNCPVGTVDSRLRDARRKLKTQLEKRGFLAGTLVALLTPTLLTANAILVRSAIQHAWKYHQSPGGVPEPLFLLANGVNAMIYSSSLKLATAVCLSVIMCGSVAVGIYAANGDDKPAVSQPEKKKEVVPPPENKPIVTPKPSLSLKELMEKTAATRKSLTKKYDGHDPKKTTLADFITMLDTQYSIKATLDIVTILDYTSEYSFEGIEGESSAKVIQSLYDQEVTLPLSNSIDIGSLIRSVLAQVKVSRASLTYTISQGDVLIIPQHQMRGIPPQVIADLEDSYSEYAITESQDIDSGISRTQIAQQINGPLVHIAVEGESLVNVLKQLQLDTGANVILDRRCMEKAAEPVTISFNNARLYTVLDILSDMYDLRLYYRENIYYITTPSKVLPRTVQSSMPQTQQVPYYGLPGFQVTPLNPTPAQNHSPAPAKED